MSENMRTSTLIIILILAILQAIVSDVSALTVGPPICENKSCDEYCPYGNMFDDNGCRTCICNKPCTNLECPPGEECRAEVLPCSSTGTPCGYFEMCGPACPLRKCVSNCPYGYEFDEEGCRTCECIDHCKNVTCPPGEVCTVEYITTFYTAAGGVRPNCTKKCNHLPCHANQICEYGFEMDCDNCPTCTCRTPPCDGVRCSIGHYCRVQTYYCERPPCPPPFASCESYCPKNSWPLIGLNDYAVRCTFGAWNCPKGYDCVKVSDLNQSFCCSTPSQ